MAVAIVTGGASGIGAACVETLQASGVEVGVVDLEVATNAEVSAVCDVSYAGELARAVSLIETQLGPPEMLVTAAGYYAVTDLADQNEAEWRRMLSVHVGGTRNAWRAVIPGMVRRRHGAVCAIGSELGLIGDPIAPHYAAAKAAIHGMVRSVGAELAVTGVRVNCVAPGPTETPLMRDDPSAGQYAAQMPLGRMLAATEIAAAVRFVLLAQTNLVGQVISPNGGAVL